MHLHHPPPPRACPGESDDPHIHQLVSWTLAFTRTWFPDGSKSSRGGGSERGGGRGGSERTTSSRLKIRLTSSRMSGVFIFSCRLVIWTFDINYLRSSHSRCLRLEMLFNVWWEDLRKAVIADSTQDTLVVQRVLRGGHFTQYFCPGVRGLHWLSYSHWVNECPRHARDGGRVGDQVTGTLENKRLLLLLLFVCLFVCCETEHSGDSRVSSVYVPACLWFSKLPVSQASRPASCCVLEGTHILWRSNIRVGDCNLSHGDDRKAPVSHQGVSTPLSHVFTSRDRGWGSRINVLTHAKTLVHYWICQ